MIDECAAKLLATVNTETERTETQRERSKRPRSATMIKLQWLAEQVRKTLRIKEQIEEGSYHVDSQSLAKALLNKIEE